MKDYEKTFRSLGYRKQVKGDVVRWLKPIGFSMLVFDDAEKKLYSRFYGRGSVKDLLCWNSIILDITDPDLWIKIGEFEENNLPSYPKYVNMSFTTDEELVNDVCG